MQFGNHQFFLKQNWNSLQRKKFQLVQATFVVYKEQHKPNWESTNMAVWILDIAFQMQYFFFSWACKMRNCNGWSFQSSVCIDCNPVSSPVEHVSKYESMNSLWSLNDPRDCMSRQVKQLLPKTFILASLA